MATQHELKLFAGPGNPELAQAVSDWLNVPIGKMRYTQWPDGENYVLVDYDSAGGTFVNGKQVAKHTLRAGDLIRIGTTHLQYSDDRGIAEAVAAPAVPTAVPAFVTPPVGRSSSIRPRLDDGNKIASRPPTP